jgi:hypothetical protein
MLPDFGIDNGAPAGSQLSQSTLLVGAHESAISRDIGRQDRGERRSPRLLDKVSLRSPSTGYRKLGPGYRVQLGISVSVDPAI